MFGTIRRHQSWLWVIIVTLTVGSFVIYFNPSARSAAGGRGGRAHLGSISGEDIDLADFRQAQVEVDLHYFITHGEWPDKDASAKQMGFDIERETYFRLFFITKFKEFNIHISPETVGRQAAEIFRMMGRNGTPVPQAEFEKQVLTPRGYTVADFKRYLENQLALQELIGVVGMSGRLVTTNEAASLFQLELQEIATEAVFFSPATYTDSLTVAPDLLSRYYTNQLARYRLPERIQLGYVKFNLTNYLSMADAQLTKVTNLDQQIDAIYLQRGGTNYYKEAKSPAEAKARIKEEQRRGFALYFAHTNATAFAEEVMAQTPVLPANLETLAAARGLTAATTEPFDAQHGPTDINVPATFARAAFRMTADEPFGGPVRAEDGVYVVALKKKLPSEIPALDRIRDRVLADYKLEQGAQLAYVAGTNFANIAVNGLAQGKTFSAIAAENGHSVVKIPPFSLSTRSLPEVEDRVSLARLQEMAVSLPTGASSVYVQTENGGGLVLHVTGRSAGDVTKIKTDFPAFLARIRQTRQGEAFNAWFSREAERGLRDTPLAHRQQQRQP